MTVKGRCILVGIRIDSNSRHLLNWAIVKVAHPWDSVLAIHVVTSPGYNQPISQLQSLYYHFD